MQKFPRLSLLKILWGLWIALDIYLVFSARPFPSEDGPLHLYYVEVVRNLFAHTGALGQFFEFKHIPPPYLFQYTTLLFLERFVDAITAEQILLASYVLWFSFAVYYLARSLGDNWIYACLFAMPLAMNLTLYLGFVNFTASVATCLLLIGFWIRHSARWTLKSVIAFLALFLLMISMHPVPVIIFSIYLAIEAVVNFTSRTREPGASFASRIGPFLRSSRILLLPGSILAVWAAWVLVLMKAYPPGSWPSHKTSLPDRIQQALFLYSLVPLHNRGFRYPVILFLIVALGLVAWTFWKHWRLLLARPGVLPVLALGILCCCAYCLVPEAAAGSAFFSIRFILPGALLLLILSACTRPSPAFSVFLAVLAAIVALNSTTNLLAMHKSVARNIGPLLVCPIDVRGHGALIAPASVTACENCNFDTYEYAGVHYFRRSGSVFLNSIWTSLPIIPLQARHRHAWDDEMPEDMVNTVARAGLADTSMPVPDFVIVSQDQEHAQQALPDRIRDLFEKRPGALGSQRFVLYVRRNPNHTAHLPSSQR